MDIDQYFFPIHHRQHRSLSLSQYKKLENQKSASDTELQTMKETDIIQSRTILELIKQNEEYSRENDELKNKILMLENKLKFINNSKKDVQTERKVEIKKNSIKKPWK